MLPLAGMRSLHAKASALVLLAAAACASRDDDQRSDPSRDIVSQAPPRAAFGLDARPANPTCIAPARPPAAARVKLEQVFANVGLEATMTMAQAPGDRSRWFVASRLGKIVSFPAASPPAVPPVVADVAALAGKPVFADLEGGFLGFAFHPKFATNGRMYVTFTTNTASTFASEVGYLTSTDGGASFTSYTKVLSFDRPIAEHNGGGIAFGQDGYLYLSFGEATDDTYGQMTTTFFGKVLRIDVDDPAGGRPYGIPAGNPFVGGGGDPEVFAYGLRNPFRLSIDRATNTCGSATWETIAGRRSIASSPAATTAGRAARGRTISSRTIRICARARSA